MDSAVKSAAMDLFLTTCRSPGLLEFRKPREVFAVFGEEILKAWAENICYRQLSDARTLFSAYFELIQMASVHDVVQPLVSDHNLLLLHRLGGNIDDITGIGTTSPNSTADEFRDHLTRLNCTFLNCVRGFPVIEFSADIAEESQSSTE